MCCTGFLIGVVGCMDGSPIVPFLFNQYLDIHRCNKKCHNKRLMGEHSYLGGTVGDSINGLCEAGQGEGISLTQPSE